MKNFQKRPRHRKKLVVDGILHATLEQAFESGCIQAGGDPSGDQQTLVPQAQMYSMLMAVTLRNPCQQCPLITMRHYDSFRQVECKCFRQYHSMCIEAQRKGEASIINATTPPGTRTYPGLSIAQIAEKLGVSKSEVRRRKAVGEI